MNTETNMSDMDAEIPENAVSVFGQANNMDDFPVLKAFQQYIDSEQAKARKRLLMLCAFFGFTMVAVIVFFVILLLNASSRTQAINDRLVEFAMKERDRAASPVVVQPQQDNNAVILSMSSRLEELQKKLADSTLKAEQMAKDAAEKARQEAMESSKAKDPTPQELEIKRLKDLLEAEKAKASAEKERKRQEELEAYRRKHYPELYEDERVLRKPRSTTKSRRAARLQEELDDADDEIDEILNDVKAIRYFDDDDDEGEESVPKRQKKPKKTVTPPSSVQAAPVQPAPVQAAPVQPAPVENKYSIPVEIKGSSSEWSIPLE